ncbi:MAG: hypothetical protein DMD25_03260 [Gemmatimonadetes bacterium]|nr:MAG: hypothetical protein DMD57_01720 [Gemmatimonadota bacterium]PYP80604.1 MAG: hypothetical protein DMD25_03260 [Gemmatimonadota bacterium]HMC18478.1 matrixin family metalloprotease [Gemmatimonadales bacterium]
MFERRMFILVAALVVLLASAALWNAFVRPPARASAGATPDTAPVQTVVRTAGSAIDSARDTAHAAAAPTPPPTVVPPVGAGGPSYIVLLARSEIRRRIRASAGSTYLNDNLTQNADSILHRWDGRVSTPVRVFFPPTTVANFQPSFLDAVRSAFQRWQEVVPVRFNLDADSSSAEVRVQWRIQFEGERSGQTDVQWDEDGRLTGGVVTLATFDAKGQPFAPDDVRVLALHEIGHLIGLDHSPDPGDIMYAQPKVRELSPRDVRTAALLYDLAPGPLRVGG